MTQSISIGNDSYIVIVANKGDAQVKVADYPADTSSNLASIMGGNSVLSSTLRVLDAGWNSDIARSLLSNTSIPTATLGRITSSVSDIMTTGRPTAQAVWEDTVNSLTNSIDEVAIDMGFPSLTALSNAINPSGSPLSPSNIAKFGNSLKNKLAGKSAIGENKINDANALNGDSTSNVIIVKLPLCTSDKETWSSSLPSKKTENGFDIVTSVQNDNLAKDFTVLVNDKTIAGSNMYATRDLLYDIWQRKYTFDVYVCDSDIRENRVYEHCMFQNVTLATTGQNSLTIDLSIIKIPEWTVKVQKLDKSQVQNGSSSSSNGKTRKTTSAKSSKVKANKTASTQRAGNSNAKSKNNNAEINSVLKDYASLRDLDKSTNSRTSIGCKNTYNQKLKKLGYTKDVETWYQENKSLGK